MAPPDSDRETLAEPSRSLPGGLGIIPREHYVIEGELARGGMGRILRARDLRLGRVVALKELLPGHGGLDARFVREALTTARLEHPAIVNVHEAGRWPSGEPFYAMKLVAGRSLDRVIDDARTQSDRLALLPSVIAVVEALAYAHDRRVIHRDLKPANVIVGSFGETVVVDWGLAKDLAASEEPGVGSDAAITVSGTVVGTPAYMPREQARGESVDERADVYSLGAILYHLLAGRPPFAGRDSTEVLRAVLAGSPEPLDSLRPEAPPDLVAIVRKAMAIEKPDRYPTAKELALDLRRFQTGQLVGAHRYTTGELAWRWVRKHRATLAVASAGLLVLAFSAVLAVSRIARERSAAVAARGQAEARSAELVLTQARTLLDRDPTASLAWLKQYPEQAARWGAARAIAADAHGRGIARRVLVGHTRHIRALAFSPDGALLASGSSDKTIRVWRLSTGESRVLQGHDWFIDGLLFLSDGRLVSDAGAEIRIWNVPTGASTLLRRTHHVRGIAVAPDRQRFAFASGEEIGLYASGKEEIVARRPAEVDVTGLAFSEDGRVLLFSDAKGDLGFLDLATRRMTTRKGTTWDPSPRGAALAYIGPDHRLWHWERGAEPRALGREDHDEFLYFAPVGDRLLTRDTDGVRLWDVRTGRSEVLKSSLGAVDDARFSPDGDWVAAAAKTSGVQLWQRSTGMSRVLRGHQVQQLAFSPDSRTLVTGGRDGTIRLWDLASADRQVLGRLPEADSEAHFDGRWFAVAGPRNEIAVWDSSAATRRTLAGHQGRIVLLRLSPDGATLASTAWDHTTRLWDLRTGEARVLKAPRAHAFGVAFSRAGQIVAVGGEDQQLQLRSWDGRLLKSLGSHELGIGCLEFSPDGRWLASTGVPLKRDDGWRHDRQLRIWNVETGQVRVLTGHEDTVSTVAWSPGGRTLATGGMDQTIRLWDANAGTGRLLARVEAVVFRVAFSPDGRYLAGSGDGRIAWLWEMPSGRRLPVPNGIVQGFSADSRQLLTLDPAPGGSAQLVDLANGESHAMGDNPSAAALGPDGRVVTVEGDGAVTLWTDVVPRDPAALRTWLAKATDLQVIVH